MLQSLDSDGTLGLRYALCIGIGTYTQLSNHNLRYAVADAKAIAEKLGDPQRGNFAVTLLTEPDQTTKAALDEAIEKLISAPDRQSEDLALLYFSCHGDVNRADNTFCLLPSNVIRKDDGTFEQTTLIGIHDVARWFEKARTHNIILLLDVCHSGGAGIALQHFKLDMNTGPNYFIIGAARQDRAAYQSSPLEHGLFTNCLLRAFGQPPTKDGWLTISQIQNFVGDEIQYFSKNDHPTQIQGSSVFVNPQLPLLRNPGYPELYPLPPIWNVPWPRNLFFTGQEHLLSQLASTLQSEHKAALTQPLAINGLGGIGKTQLALEYAYRHRQDYHAVLWGRADTREALVSTFVSIAYLLDLPQKDEKDQMVTVEAVKAWLANRRGWLFILDNANDLALVKEFIPPALRGLLLLTTRAQAMGGLVLNLEVKVMSPESGALLLLRRSRLVAPSALLEDASPLDVALAKEITEELGGLPLALDQAGAYIEETQRRLADYRDRYRTQTTKLLRKRGGLMGDHPESVATTFSLSFEEVEQRSPMAADILRFCAYLAPDAIPEEIITQGLFSIKLGQEENTILWQSQTTSSREENSFLLDEAVTVLGAYSLIHRDHSHNMISLHRLVQVVLRESMATDEEEAWKARVILAIILARPDVEDAAQWDACERWLPHALVCTAAIKQKRDFMAKTGPDVVFSADASLLSIDGAFFDTVGYYLHRRGRYAEAEQLLKQALAITEQELGSTHLDTAMRFYHLGNLYQDQGKYAEAEPLLKQALAITEQELGPTHPDTARSLNSLGSLYQDQGRYSEAEPLLKRALAITEQELGPNHYGTATSLNNLAILYSAQRKYKEAELLYRRTLTIIESTLGPTDPNTAAILSSLATLYQDQGKYAEAEPLLKRALMISEEKLGLDHPDIVRSLDKLVSFYKVQGKFSEAELVLKRALAIREQELGATHPGTTVILNNLAMYYLDQREYAEAEPLLKQALAIAEQTLGPTDPETAGDLINLATYYREQRRYAEAEPLLKRALAIAEQTLEPADPLTAVNLNNLAQLYREQRRYAEAEPLQRRALAIAEQVWGPSHRATQAFRKNYTSLSRNMERQAKRGSWKKIRDLFSQ